MTTTPTFSYRPAFGRGLTIAVAVVCALAVVVTLFQDGFAAAGAFAPWMLLVAWVVWALFWAPEVRVDAAGVHLVNVTRTLHLPWPSIRTVDTKWAFAVVTGWGTYTAWAAPAGSRRSGRQLSPQDVTELPESTFGPGRSIRPGDSPNSPSGQVALFVRRRLEELHRAGHLDDPKLETDKVPTRWHVESLAVGAALLLWGMLAVLL